MSQTNRYFIGFLVAVFVVFLGAIFYFQQGNVVSDKSSDTAERLKPAAHFYKNPRINLARVVLKVFYVVPQNRKDKIDPNLEETLENTLEKAAAFHKIQFRELSELKYDIFPKPIILKEENGFYDTEDTNRGNPYALLRVSREVNDRVFIKGGDLYDEEFVRVEEGEYPVMGLIYEGVGASGSAIYESELNSAAEIARQLGIPESEVKVVKIKEVDGFFILNREFLTNPELSLHGVTTLYHEFGHTLGLPDNYNTETNQPFYMDIMGGGREETIELMYFDRLSLRDMGVLGK